MSLTQRAKKKLFGSLAKRKKLKVPEDGDVPSSAPRTRPPLPDFMALPASITEPAGSLSTSTSLPDQIDRLGNSDFSLYSSTLSVNIPTNKVHEGSLHLKDNAVSSSQSLECLASSSQLSSGSYLDPAERSSSSEFIASNDKENVNIQTGQASHHSADTTDHNTTLKENANERTFLPGRSKHSSRSRSSPSLVEIFPENVGGDQFVNSLFSEIISSYQYCNSVGEDGSVEKTLHMDNDRESPDASDLYEEVFEAEDKDPPSQVPALEYKERSFKKPLDLIESKDQCPINSTEDRIGQIMKTQTADSVPNSDITIDIHKQFSLPNIPRMDSFVSNKVKFFEQCNENGSGSSPQNNSTTETTPATLQSNKRPITDLGTDQQNPLQKQTKTMSLRKFSNSSAEYPSEASGKVKKVTRPASSYRGITNSELPTLRLNFNRFKRSGAIPECVAKCSSCGRCCEDDCLTVSMMPKPNYGATGAGSAGEVNSGNATQKSSNSQVCYHPLCTEDNGGLPLMLCRQCEQEIHKNPDYSGHLVLDSRHKRDQASNRPASPSFDVDDDSDSDAQQPGEEDRVDGLFLKNNSQIRSKHTNSELERKLRRRKALKKKGKSELEDALAQIADPEGFDSSMYYRMDSDSGEQRSPADVCERPDYSLEDVAMSSVQRQDSLESSIESIITADSYGLTSRVPVRRQSRVSLTECNFTLKFGCSEGGQEELVAVAAKRNVTLREAIEAVLVGRKIDVNTVNVFIEKSHTPLPMSSDTSFLVGNILEIKEKDDKEPEPTIPTKSRPGNSKSGSAKANKQAGRNSRRESVGVVPVLLEPPPTKQRRGSLQLPFREHFFNKGDSKNSDGLKVYDDSFGSLRGRSRSGNLSVDDTFYPATSPGGSWSEAKRGKSPKLSVVGLFGPTNKDKERQDQLIEILNRYSLHGLPPFPELLSLGRPKFDDSIFQMEPSWKSIVTIHQSMTKKQQEHQEAVWELLGTEVSYIKQIRVIIDVFQNCLINVQQESFLNEIETERLFSNIDKVFECNCHFWQQYLLPVLQQGRESKQPLEPLLSKEGFVDHFRSMFQVYFKYFIEHKSCLEYAKTCMENSDLFKTFIQWAETQKQCNRLKLADILVKPMQRLLKYSLLLQAILKHTDSVKDKADIQEMIQSVDKLCWAANNSLRQLEEYEKLEAVRKTIDPYDAIEAPNDECARIIQEHNGNFNLLVPLPGIFDGPRSLVFHSSLRMREPQNVKLDIDCLLFTDLILICKSNKRMERFKIIRPPMRLDRLVVSELKDKGSFLLIYMNEYSVPLSAFTFHSDVGAIRLWLEKFRETQREFKAKKMQKGDKLEHFHSHAATDQVEEETSILNVPSYLDLASTTLPRSESTESADRFMPNLLTPTDTSGDPGRIEHTRSSSTGDFQSHSTHSAPHRDLPHASTEPKLVSPSATDFSPSSKHRTITEGQSVVTKHKPVQTSRSVPNIMVGNNSGTQLSATSPTRCGNNPEVNPVFQDQGDDPVFQSSSASDRSHDINLSPSQSSLSEQNSVSDEEDLAKLKLNSRRVSRTEKRYHTADAIQDMKMSTKDASIHKRLSWRTDVQMDNKNLDSKVQSTDSVRSVPSSSGVSSIGSLHLTMENEISEEQEGNSNDSDNYSCSSPTRVDSQKLFSLGDTEDNDDDASDDSSSKQPKSKSTSDLATMFSNSLQVSQIEDGIASVAMTTDCFNRKLTHADILKMKKLKHQILYDANIESSEV